MNTDNALHFKDSQEWRAWLEKNHDSNPGVWLVHYKKKSAQASVSHDDAVQEAICFGWIDGKLMSIATEKYMLRYTPRKANSVWSKINKDKAGRLIESGKMTAAGLAAIDEAKKHGLWDGAYTNKKKERIPPDLKEALLEDRDAWSNFQKFANSYRNQYIGWITGAKTEETRRKRIAEVAKRSALNKKTGGGQNRTSNKGIINIRLKFNVFLRENRKGCIIQSKRN